MNRAVGGRMHWSVLGHATGFIAGALLALPLGLWWVSSTGPVAWEDSRLWTPSLAGAALGMEVGRVIVHSLTAMRSDWRPIALSGLKWAAGGYLVGLIGAAPFWWFTGSLLLPGFLLFYVTAKCAGFGLTLGLTAATQAEKARQDELAQRLGDLEGQRAALEADILGRFGPLDESRGAAIRTWDKDRVAEARRKLDVATTVEDLDD